MEVILTRLVKDKTQTLGELIVFEGDNAIYHCKTMELEEDINAVRDDCIPPGTYNVVKRYSAKYKEHFHVLDVPNRSYILIHSANYSRQLLGCIAVGKEHIDIDHDGLEDVTNSRVTMRELNNILPNKFKLQII